MAQESLPQPVSARLLLAIDDVRHVLGGLGRTKVYALASAGEITRCKIGHRTFITAESVAAYVDRLSQAASEAA